MIADLKTRCSEFGNNTGGAVAMMFGLMILGLIFVSGMAIDYSRMTHMRARVSAAVDAAGLAGGRALLDGRLSDQEVKDLAVASYRANLADLTGTFGSVDDPAVVVDRSAGTVDIDASTTVPMTFMKIAGFSDVTIPVDTLAKFDQRNVELGMALDVTGSMGGSKIADLRLAANDLIDILLPDGGTPNTIRIGLAPYSTSINAGVFAPSVTGVGSASCVYERGGSEAFTDIEPAGGDVLGQNGTTWCPNAIVEPITDDKAQLKASISSYTANGWTAGHLGIAWAWYLISPNWSAIWPALSTPVAYSDTETIKAVILMTDGEFNTAYVPGNGNSSNQATQLCDEIKNNEVVVYSVAFQAPGSAQALLQGCASSPGHYFPASNGAELRAAFQQIAVNLNKLRLTK